MKARAIYSEAPAAGWLPWGALAPFLALVFVVVPLLAGSKALEWFRLANAKGDPVGIGGLFAFLLLPFTLMGLVVLIWVRAVEQRPWATIGLGSRVPARAFVRGLGIGLATLAAVVVAIWSGSGFRAAGFGRAWGALPALLNISLLLVCFAVQASVEELLFRGWLLSAVARKFNLPLAVLLTSAVFTLLHFAPRQHWAAVLNFFLFSVFACAWSLRSGHIWGVMGWHAGWNWLLAVGFELPVTGLDAGLPALLVKLVPEGSVLANGGALGPEGSLWCTLFFVLGIALLSWRGRATEPAPSPPHPQELP